MDFSRPELTCYITYFHYASSGQQNAASNLQVMTYSYLTENSSLFAIYRSYNTHKEANPI